MAITISDEDFEFFLQVAATVTSPEADDARLEEAINAEHEMKARLFRIADEHGLLVTKTGKVLTEEEIQRLADEAEEDYDLSRVTPRRRG